MWRSRTSRTGNDARIRELARDSTVRLPPGRGGVLARVLRGTVLVTQAGDPEDHVLGPGDEARLPPGGLVVAWALTPSVIATQALAARPAAAAPVLEPCA